MNVCEVDVEDSQPLSVFIVKLLGFTRQWSTRGKTLTALLHTFGGLSLNFENCRDKPVIFSISHLVLF